MKWVTREHPKTDRIACPWLIRKFIDPDAEIVYVSHDEVLEYAGREGATSFDAPGAKYTHRDSKCSFETLVEEYHIDDPAVALLAKVVHGADVSEDRDATPESRGLLAIAGWLRAARTRRPAPAGAGATGLRRAVRLGGTPGQHDLTGEPRPRGSPQPS